MSISIQTRTQRKARPGVPTFGVQRTHSEVTQLGLMGYRDYKYLTKFCFIKDLKSHLAQSRRFASKILCKGDGKYETIDQLWEGGQTCGIIYIMFPKHTETDRAVLTGGDKLSLNFKNPYNG